MTATLTDRKTGLITRYFMIGHTIDYIAERGVYEGWTRDEIWAVVDARRWNLDASGRIPRSQRTERPATAPAPPPTPAAEPPPVRPAPPPAPAPVATVKLPEQPVRATGVYIAALQARDFGVDQDYQRPLDEARVARMVRDWNPRKLGTLHVSDRGEGEHPRYAVVDGKHRAAAAAKVSPLGADVWLACNVHEGLTVEEEARLMRELDRDTKRLSGFDKWRARKVEGDPVVRAVEAIATAHGLQIENAASDGTLAAHGTAEKLYKLGGEKLLHSAIAVLHVAYGAAAAGYQAPLLMAVGQLLHKLGSELDVERLTNTLRGNRPEKLRAAATALRDVQTGPLYALMAEAITTAYNRTPGSGPRLHYSR